MQDKQTIKTRLAQFLQYLGIGQAKFASIVGVSKGFANNVGDSIRADNLEKIANCYPELNLTWLLTGEGEMLKNTELVEPVDLPGIPYYDINVTASITESFNDMKELPQYTINVPPLNDCTAAFPVFGESMMPDYNPGDTVLVKEIRNLNSMLWGETYLIITNAECDNMRTIKRVYISDDRQNFILRATNPNYVGDTIVPCCNVLKIFIVKGKISRTQL